MSYSLPCDLLLAMRLHSNVGSCILHKNRTHWAITPIMRMFLLILKVICLFIPTFAVIYFVGTILLVGLFGILGGTPYLVFSRDLSGMPFVFYAFGIGWKVALMAAF